jgi:putative Mg2+ transporter-C (MgtC) family protein
MSDTADMLLRMAAAAGTGALIGFERSLHNGRFLGVRTLSLVGLSSCIAVLCLTESGLGDAGADAVGRVLQGILSGVGFIGAGALLHRSNAEPVHGLATAASIWMAAVLGAASALGDWPLIGGGIGIGLAILFGGAAVERRIRARPADRRPDKQE